MAAAGALIASGQVTYSFTYPKSNRSAVLAQIYTTFASHGGAAGGIAFLISRPFIGEPYLHYKNGEKVDVKHFDAGINEVTTITVPSYTVSTPGALLGALKENVKYTTDITVSSTVKGGARRYRRKHRSTRRKRRSTQRRR